MNMVDPSGRRWFALLFAALYLLCGGQPSWLLADDAPDDLEDRRPGVLAVYTTDTGHSITRVQSQVQLAELVIPSEIASHSSLASVRWRGRLLSIAPGEYRLHVFATGHVRLRLDGRSLLDESSAAPRWFDATPVELQYGNHRLELDYEPSAKGSRCGLYWEGPRFQLEPVMPQWLSRDPRDLPEVAIEDGASLVLAARCNRCHRIASINESPASPALSDVRFRVSPAWVAHWLGPGRHGPLPASKATQTSAAPKDDAPHGETDRLIPRLDLTREEVRAVTAYLFAADRDNREPHTPDHQAKKPGHVDQGRRLFYTVGCLACHRVDGLGGGGRFSGPDLSEVGRKHSPEFFIRWLQDPTSLNVDHRMPIYDDPVLDEQQRADLAAFLKALKGNRSHRADSWSDRDFAEPPATVVAAGRRLVDRFGCGNCHRLPGKRASAGKPLDWPEKIVWQAGCLGKPDHTARRPGFTFSPQQAAAIRRFIDQAEQTSSLGPLWPTGRVALEINNCTACHARNTSAGIAAHWPGLVERSDDLASRLSAMAPPALSGVGDKLPDAELDKAIASRYPRLRPWLDVRMPRFAHLSDERRGAIRDYLIAADRIPPGRLPPRREPRQSAMRVAGARLVTSSGFGCTSCHQIGSTVPEKVELKAHGTDLSLLGKRLRREWFDRWVRNPARIIPRMEMPSIELPVPQVLGGNLDAQLASVWYVLNVPHFNPPEPNPIRVVRKLNQPGIDEPASVLTDVLEIGRHRFVSPWLLGLPNRHNVLFDLANFRLAAWWIGDTARQRTRGKSWYWQAGGVQVLPVLDGTTDLVLVDERGQTHHAVRQGQFVTEVDSFEKTGRGATFVTRLHFEATSRLKPGLVIRVTQSISPLPDSADTASPGQTGFARRITIEDLPAGWSARLRVLPLDDTSGTLRYRGGTAVEFSSATTHCTVRCKHPSTARVVDLAAAPWLSLSAQNGFSAELDYQTTLPVDRFLRGEVPAPEHEPANVNVVPGFQGTRLPVTDELMPTGLAWQADGTLIVSSLKGRVWRLRDTSGDGLEDTATPLSDELAAPYGVAAHGDAVDVINKYALLRLYDTDHDGRAERTETLASGWGHTEDYHDWAVGLPRDEDGNYYIALPCQQDQRGRAAAYLRGAAIRLVPRAPTRGDPRRYRAEPLSTGLRFPMGLALRRDGELFATDNQGNYNPFNELNHLLPGQQYGFINQIDRRKGFRPPFRNPAIDVPHPWTRSVNGICFLDTPPKVRKRIGRNRFGPFEGHLVGCEYDTRRLIRMTLDRVGDRLQGAAYPLSRMPREGEQGLLGPIVCAISPAGDLYVGNMRDSAWGGGSNNGTIVRLRPNGQWPLGIAEVRAVHDGLRIEFTGEIETSAAHNPEKYTITSYRRIATPDYGGPDVDRRTDRIQQIDVGTDRRHVTVHLGTLREGFVYELRIGPLGPDGKTLWPAEAYYTLNKIPER